jgi:hypothetical protein
MTFWPRFFWLWPLWSVQPSPILAKRFREHAGERQAILPKTPVTDRLAVVELIGATTTTTGLKVESVLDSHCQKAIKVSDAEMARLNIRGDKFHPEWNYTIRPRQQPP